MLHAIEWKDLQIAVVLLIYLIISTLPENQIVVYNDDLAKRQRRDKQLSKHKQSNNKNIHFNLTGSDDSNTIVWMK